MDLEKLQAAGCEVTASYSGITKPPRREMLHLPHLPCKGVPYSHDNTVANTLHSVRERVLGRTLSDGSWNRTVRPKAGAFNQPSLTQFRRRVSRYLPRHSLPISHDQFVGSYQGQKRQRYSSAQASLAVKPLVASDSFPGVFLKSEKWFRDAAGRVISARGPRYNLALGCYIQPIEHAVYRAIDQVFGSPTIMKGYTPERRAAVIAGHWAAMEDPVAVGQDFSKFDQHISVEALQFEHAFYQLCYDSPELARLLARQLKTTCYATTRDGKVVYKLNGVRMSGDMNTALGNCIISAALVWAYAAEKGIKIRAVVDGDDSVTFLERKDYAAYAAGIAEYMLDHGFILVSEEPVYELHKVEFCQARYTRLAPPTMVRTPLKAITQDHEWIVDNGVAHADVLSATGLGGLSLYGACPVLGAYYHMLSRASPNSARTLRRMMNESTWLRAASDSGVYTEPTEEARYAFWETWDVEPGEQRAMEAFFNSQNLGYLADCPRSYDHQNIHNQIYFPSLNQFS